MTDDIFPESALPPSDTGNPLASYFRLPGLNAPLPTGGAFLPKGSKINADGSVPVLPMRTADEYLLKNPDALLSGFAILKLLESCVPAIADPQQISTPDLDVILLAIRAATYGENMDVNAMCPNCRHENEFECNLPNLLGNVKSIPAENPVRLTDEIVAYVRPHTFANATRIAKMTFDEARRLQNIENEEERNAQGQIVMEKISQLQQQVMSACVVKIVTPTAEVTNPEHICEFMANVTRAWVSKIEAKLNEINALGLDKRISVECQSCQHVWQTQIEFDPTSFFASGS